MATEVDLGLKEIQQLLDDENKNEEEFQVHFILHKIRQACHDLMYDKSDKKRTAIFIFFLSENTASFIFFLMKIFSSKCLN